MRQVDLEIAQLAEDTHGYTEFAIALAKLLGFDLCSRLKAPKDRHLIVPRGTEIPQNFRPICHPDTDVSKIVAQRDAIVHLVACVHSGHKSTFRTP